MASRRMIVIVSSFPSDDSKVEYSRACSLVAKWRNMAHVGKRTHHAVMTVNIDKPNEFVNAIAELVSALENVKTNE